MAKNVWSNVNFDDSNISGYAKDMYGVNQEAINSIKSLINVGQDIENQTKNRNSLALLDKLSTVTNPEEFNAIRSGINLTDLNKSTQNTVLAQTQQYNKELEQRNVSSKLIDLYNSKDPASQKEILNQLNKDTPLDEKSISTLNSVIDKTTQKQNSGNTLQNVLESKDTIVPEDKIQSRIDAGDIQGAKVLMGINEKIRKNEQELAQIRLGNIINSNDSVFTTPTTPTTNNTDYSNVLTDKQFVPVNSAKLTAKQIQDLPAWNKNDLIGVSSPFENTGLNASNVGTQNSVNPTIDTSNLFDNSYSNFNAALAQTAKITDPIQRAKAVEDIKKELETNKDNDVKNTLVKDFFDEKDVVSFLDKLDVQPKDQKKFVEFHRKNKDISTLTSAYNEVISFPVNLPVKNMVTKLNVDVANLKNQLESNPEVNARKNISTTLKTFNNQPQEKTLKDATDTISSLSGQDYSENYVKKVATRVANNHLQKYGKSVSVNDVLAAMTYSTESDPGSILTLGYNDTFNENKILDNVRKYKTDPSIAASDRVYKNKTEDLNKYEKLINELQQRIGFNYNRGLPFVNEINALNKIQDEVKILLSNNKPKNEIKDITPKIDVLNKVSKTNKPPSYLYGKGII
jgi:hypothetical protein